MGLESFCSAKSRNYTDLENKTILGIEFCV